MHRSGCLAWAPLILFFTTELAMWFVVTFVVLLPVICGPGSSFDVFSPHKRTSYMESAVGWLLLIIYQLLFALLLASVVRTVRTAPGDIPSWLRSDGKSDLHSYTNLLQAVERKKKTNGPRYCRKTAVLKPDRAHYCPEVSACVLQYQLFSSVANSPIGFFNYKYYVLSLFYGALTSAWVVGATLPEVFALDRRLGSSIVASYLVEGQPLWQMLMRAVEPRALSNDQGETAAVMCVVVTLSLSALMIVPCLGLLGWHVLLIAQGRTAHEWFQLRAGVRSAAKSQFDYGALNNFALTLGLYPLFWLVPTRTGIEGNGIFFPEKVQAERQW